MSGQLPTWLADRLGISTAQGADGATWQLHSAWSWPPWLTVLLALAIVLFTVILYSRESSGAGRAYRAMLVALRLAAFSIVLVMLAQWALALRLTGPPSVALVIDRSASMGIADRYTEAELPVRFREQLVAGGMSEPTRLNLAKLLVAADDARFLNQLAERYRLQLYFVAGGVERLPATEDQADQVRAIRELTANGSDSHATRLGDAVRQVLDDSRAAPPAAIILLTDGVTTAGLPLAEAAQHARRKGVPIVAVGLGSDQPPRDIELADVLVDEVVFVDDPVNIQVQIKATGLEGQRATITLRRDSRDEAADALAEQQITLPPTGQTLTAHLMHRPTEPGRIAYHVEITPRDDELNRQNNRQGRTVDVRDAKLRVLLVHGYPSYEFRFLKTLLERDATIQLATYLQDADPDYSEQDKTALRSFPISRDELFEYDVLLIGDIDPRLAPRTIWQNLRAFVAEKGGGVAFIAGPRYLPWLYADNSDVATLLPIDLSDFAVAPDSPLPKHISQGFAVLPTPIGLQNPALQLGDTPDATEQIWRALPELYWLYPIDDLKPGTQVLAQTSSGPPPSAFPLPPSPVICFQYVGAGRVLFHAVDSTWRWRLGAGDVYFSRYWVQAIRFLARGGLTSGRGAKLFADRRQYRRGEPVELRVRFLDPRLAPAGNDVTVVLDTHGRPRRRVVLHRSAALENIFQASCIDLADGQYEVLLTEPQLPGEPPTAQFAVVAPPGELSRQQMDSAALSTVAAATHGNFYTIVDTDRLLTELPAGRREPVKNLPPISVWNRWWMLAGFLLVITAEWILRKRKGML